MYINDNLTTVPIAIADKPVGGVIGTAATTVDIGSLFLVTQNTAGQVLTLPAPSNPRNGLYARVVGIGSASFTMYGVGVDANANESFGDFVWANSAWRSQRTANNSSYEVAVVRASGTIDIADPIAAGARPIVAGSFNVASAIGLDSVGTDARMTVTFTAPLSTANYIISGSLRSKVPAAWNTDNDTIWTVVDKSTAGFTMSTRELAGAVQGLFFDFQVVERVTVTGSATLAPIPPVIQRFLANGTYTPTVGMKYVTVEMVGGGGGGGSVDAATALQLNTSGAGGAGGYLKLLLTAAQIGASRAITIGAGGLGGVGVNVAGAAGGSTIVVGIGTANGGNGGSAGLVGTTGSRISNVGYGGLFTINLGTDIGSRSGQPAQPSYANAIGTANCIVFAAEGGKTVFSRQSPGGAAAFNVAMPVAAGGNNLLAAVIANTGDGGDGRWVTNRPTQSGGNGSSGVVVITEYFA